MIDLHTHTLLSDGVLLPFELLRRYKAHGATSVALTDHVDPSNIESVIPKLIKACQEANNKFKIKAIPGCELTHLPLDLFLPLVKLARKLGAKLIIAHGETLVEPVLSGTNRAAILGGIDILAHPGLISEKDCRLASERNVYLEISSREGHSLSNGHVARLAKLTGAKLIFGSDSHEPKDIRSKEDICRILLGAGLNKKETEQVFCNAKTFIK